MSTPTMMKKNADRAVIPAPPPPPPAPHHHHHHHRVSSSSSIGVGVGVGSVVGVGVGVLPTIRGWTHDASEGTVSGFMSGSRIFPDGSPVTTSRLVVDPGAARLTAGCIVQTKSGSRYVLGDEARKGGAHHRLHHHPPRGAPMPPQSSSTAAPPWSSSMMRRLLRRRPASHLRSIGGAVASRLSSLDAASRRALRLAAASLYVLVAIAVFGATHRPSGHHPRGDVDGGGGPPRIGISPDRDKCQIVYVIGVEGSVHHGVTPILRALAGHQVDRETGLRYEVSYADRELRSAVFGFNRNARSIDNPTMVRFRPREKKKKIYIYTCMYIYTRSCVSRLVHLRTRTRRLGLGRNAPPPTSHLFSAIVRVSSVVVFLRRPPTHPPPPLFAFGHHPHPPLLPRKKRATGPSHHAADMPGLVGDERRRKRRRRIRRSPSPQGDTRGPELPVRDRRRSAHVSHTQAAMVVRQHDGADRDERDGDESPDELARVLRGVFGE